MAKNKDTKYVQKCRIILGTQEEATALNNGGAMQIVLNRRVRSSTVNSDSSSRAPTNNGNKSD